jgi:hypothetical protein
MLEPRIENLENVMIPERIENDLPLSSWMYHVEIPQYPKLMRYGGFAYFEQNGQIPDAHLSFPQGEKNSHPGGISQGPEHSGKFLTGFFRGCFFKSLFQPLRVKTMLFGIGTGWCHAKILLWTLEASYFTYEYMFICLFRQEKVLGILKRRWNKNIFIRKNMIFSAKKTTLEGKRKEKAFVCSFECRAFFPETLEEAVFFRENKILGCGNGKKEKFFQKFSLEIWRIAFIICKNLPGGFYNLPLTNVEILYMVQAQSCDAKGE